MSPSPQSSIPCWRIFRSEKRAQKKRVTPWETRRRQKMRKKKLQQRKSDRWLKERVMIAARNQQKLNWRGAPLMQSNFWPKVGEREGIEDDRVSHQEKGAWSSRNQTRRGCTTATDHFLSRDEPDAATAAASTAKPSNYASPAKQGIYGIAGKYQKALSSNPVNVEEFWTCWVYFCYDFSYLPSVLIQQRLL